MVRKPSDNELYQKYPHVLPGSIETTSVDKKIAVGKDEYLISKGRICVIRCAYADCFQHCQKTRIINLQDAKQVKHCNTCVKYMRNLRRRQKD